VIIVKPALANRQRSTLEWECFGAATQLCECCSEARKYIGNMGIVGAEAVLIDRKRSRIEWL